MCDWRAVWTRESAARFWPSEPTPRWPVSPPVTSADSTVWQRRWGRRTDELQAWRRRWRAHVTSSLRVGLFRPAQRWWWWWCLHEWSEITPCVVFPQICGKCVCVCVFSYAWWAAHSGWLKTEALWGRLVEADRVMVVHCWTKLQQLVNCNNPQTKTTPPPQPPPTVLSQPRQRRFL